jgi:hypothetical protein
MTFLRYLLIQVFAYGIDMGAFILLIQFDFIDNVGAAHSISLHSPIKDN